MTQAVANTDEQLTAKVLAGEVAAWLPRLAGLLDEQCGLCAQLESLSARQSEAVRAGDTDVLLRVLGQRQSIVDRVSQINASLEPFRSQKESLLGRLGPAQRDGVVQKVGRIAALVESVRARDDADRASLEKQRSRVADELAGLTRGRGAAAAYVNMAVMGAGGPRFQDRKG
jgi:hypothetical protein